MDAVGVSSEIGRQVNLAVRMLVRSITVDNRSDSAKILVYSRSGSGVESIPFEVTHDAYPKLTK